MRSCKPAALRLPALCACALLCAFAWAQASPYRPGAPLLMWKVSSGSNSAYVLGSVHLGNKEMYPLPAVVEDAFRASSVLIVEVDIRHVDPSSLQQFLVAGAYPPGDDLFKHIKPETRMRLISFLGSSLPPELYSRVRPWALGTMIQSLAMMKAGLDPSNGIDMHFLNEAADKRVEQLEDANWQIKLLSEMPESMADEWIAQNISEAEGSQEHWAKLATYWGRGAADELDTMITGESANDSADAKAFERRLREDRNPHMTDRLEQCLQSKQSCFMVVGAAHVIGKEGIIKQLQARGYRVEQATVENKTK
jgi:uncharacterized protein YbaP (TraB family)